MKKPMKYSDNNFDEYGYPKEKRGKDRRSVANRNRNKYGDDNHEEESGKKKGKANSGRHYTRRRKKHDK
tara:strand:+ start:2224 stop:2430 length:207 start_codon:yes stop_codon:yes gene_type:complete